MAGVQMTMAEARAAAAADFDRATIEATTEDDIRRQMIEDGEDPDAPLGAMRTMPPLAAIRARVGMSQERFAKALRIPTKTLRNWEQGRTRPDPVALSFFALVADDPDRAFKVLGEAV